MWKKLKITSKWANMLDERENSNFEDDDKLFKLQGNLGRVRPKKVNSKFLKQEFLKGTNEF